MEFIDMIISVLNNLKNIQLILLYLMSITLANILEDQLLITIDNSKGFFLKMP